MLTYQHISKTRLTSYITYMTYELVHDI